MSELKTRVKGSFEGPRWARIDQFIKEVAHFLDLDCTVERDTGVLREYVRFKVEGRAEAVDRLETILREAVEKY